MTGSQTVFSITDKKTSTTLTCIFTETIEKLYCICLTLEGFQYSCGYWQTINKQSKTKHRTFYKLWFVCSHEHMHHMAKSMWTPITAVCGAVCTLNWIYGPLSSSQGVSDFQENILLVDHEGASADQDHHYLRLHSTLRTGGRSRPHRQLRRNRDSNAAGRSENTSLPRWTKHLEEAEEGPGTKAW